MAKLIHIFKAGKHQPLSGEPIEFTEAMLQSAVDAYDRALFDAPLVIGHPKLDDPAYGWVAGLHISDGQLYAEPVDVDPQFAELVEQKRYKKISASWYLPDAPNNPKPGTLYLRHVGFLGAAAPSVKGLRNASFAADEQGVVEFADWDQITISNLFRRLREYIIGRDGAEAADKVLPDYEINSLQINAVDTNPHRALFADPSTIQQGDTDTMTPEEKARLDALEAENKTLKDNNAKLSGQVTEFSERETKARSDAQHAENVSFAEGLIKEGRLLPGAKDSTVALMDKLALESSAVEFGEGDGKQSKTPLEIYREQLQAQPVVVDFGEHGAGSADAGVANFAAPQGYTADAAALEIHSKALAHQAANPSVSYIDAVKQVSK